MTRVRFTAEDLENIVERHHTSTYKRLVIAAVKLHIMPHVNVIDGYPLNGRHYTNANHTLDPSK